MITATLAEPSAVSMRARVADQMNTSVESRPKTTGYLAALAAFAASRRLHVIATVFITFVIIVGCLGAIACVVVFVRGIGAHSAAAMAIAGAALFGCAFWTVAGLLIGMAAQTYARDVQARAPWQPK